MSNFIILKIILELYNKIFLLLESSCCDRGTPCLQFAFRGSKNTHMFKVEIGKYRYKIYRFTCHTVFVFYQFEIMLNETLSIFAQLFLVHPINTSGNRHLQGFSWTTFPGASLFILCTCIASFSSISFKCPRSQCLPVSSNHTHFSGNLPVIIYLNIM